ncbi:hypothetical protein YTPLAS72_03340 [Nitrospira sp.]|nr:hypothetical protein YTPLAS72_03340 [Nitrospira sp.]
MNETMLECDSEFLKEVGEETNLVEQLGVISAMAITELLNDLVNWLSTQSVNCNACCRHF